MSFQEEITTHLAKFNTSPFLFVGSGFSRRYYGLPTWEALLIEMVTKLSLSKPYEYYKSNSDGRLPQVASMMGDEFNSIWWSSELFEENRRQHQKEISTKFCPLKLEITKHLQDKSNLLDDEILKKEINLLKKANIDGVITTNWDTLIEELFPTFTSFIGQEELIFSELFTIGEIYKIHGSTTSPSSLVLTSEDYENFDERNTYLAAKLLTLFIEHPIIFIGYSLDDKNIQNILKSIVKCLTKDKVTKLQDRLLFCQWVDGDVITTITDSSMLISDTVIPIKLIKLNTFLDLFTVLANNKKKLPTKVLRQMKGMIYDFVKSNNSKQKIFVADNLDDIENIHKAEFVYGVGIKDKLSDIGIKGIGLKDLHEDIINDKGWNSESIAKLCLTQQQLTARFVPYFKHLKIAGFLDEQGKIDDAIDVVEFSPSFITKVNNITRNDFFPAQNYAKKEDETNAKYNSLEELVTALPTPLHQLVYIPLLQEDKIDLLYFGDYLEKNMHLLDNSSLGSHFRKLVCLYDFLKNKQ